MPSQLKQGTLMQDQENQCQTREFNPNKTLTHCKAKEKQSWELALNTPVLGDYFGDFLPPIYWYSEQFIWTPEYIFFRYTFISETSKPTALSDTALTNVTPISGVKWYNPLCHAVLLHIGLLSFPHNSSNGTDVAPNF